MGTGSHTARGNKVRRDFHPYQETSIPNSKFGKSSGEVYVTYHLLMGKCIKLLTCKHIVVPDSYNTPYMRTPLPQGHHFWNIIVLKMHYNLFLMKGHLLLEETFTGCKGVLKREGQLHLKRNTCIEFFT